MRGAKSYHVYVAFANGARQFYSTTARRLRIGAISAEVTALVTVQATGDKVYTLPSVPASANSAPHIASTESTRADAGIAEAEA